MNVVELVTLKQEKRVTERCYTSGTFQKSKKK